MLLSVPVLGMPALLLAGLASSAHCAMMCGLLHARRAEHGAWALQTGRLCAYGLLGAAAGGAGHLLLRTASLLPYAEALRIAALPVLLALLLRDGARPRPPCCAPGPQGRFTPRHRFVAGLLGGLMPCPLLYAAAAYAALSASVTQGALMMLAFGFGTLPAVQAGAWGWRRIGVAAAPPWIRTTAVLVSFVTAGAMLVALSSGAAGGWLCLGVNRP